MGYLCRSLVLETARVDTQRQRHGHVTQPTAQRPNDYGERTPSVNKAILLFPLT